MVEEGTGVVVWRSFENKDVMLNLILFTLFNINDGFSLLGFHIMAVHDPVRLLSKTA